MTKARNLSLVDNVLAIVDRTLKTLVPGSSHASRPCPGEHTSTRKLDIETRRHIAGLMRINHAGEVSAQALYQGQKLTARTEDMRAHLSDAADEEVDHLAWCETRLTELGSRPSYLSPLWYAGAFTIGAVAGLIGDKWSLGFIVETERQVEAHLQSHIDNLPEDDERSRAILTQMRIDEGHHADNAMYAGAHELPDPIPTIMHYTAEVMKRTAYYV